MPDQPVTAVTPPAQALALRPPGTLAVLPVVPEPPEPAPPTPSLARRSLTWARTQWAWLLLAVAGLATLAAFAPLWLLGPQVVVAPVSRGHLIRSVVAVGQVLSPFRINIGSQVTGTVARVAVAEGQSVTAGQLLIQLDETEARAATDQAMAAEAQARNQLSHLATVLLPVAEAAERQAAATLLNAQNQFSRANTLVASGFATRVALDAARAARDVASGQLASARLELASNQPGGADEQVQQAALAQAQAALRAAHSRLGYTSITAPVAGVLIARSVEHGDVVQPLATLLVLSPAGPPQLQLQVDERSFGQLAIGQAALVRADAYPEQRFAARVSFINPAVDASRASVQTKLDVPNPPPWLVQDMTVNVDITVAERDNVLLLPLSAVHDAHGPTPWVLRAEAGRARRVPVTLGLHGTRLAEVTAGLAEHDAILPAAAPVTEGGRLRVQLP